MVSPLSTTTFSFAWDGSPLSLLLRYMVFKAAAMLLHDPASLVHWINLPEVVISALHPLSQTIDWSVVVKNPHCEFQSIPFP